MRGYVKRAKRMQDVLGEHQDAVVAAQAVRELDGQLHRPMAHAAAAALAEAQDARRVAIRGVYRKAWKRLDRRARALA
jgi:CHAD domain-containing protein